MKKYVYILLRLHRSVIGHRQIKIELYFKDGGEDNGELKGRKPNGKGKQSTRTEYLRREYIKGKREEWTYTFHDGEKYVGQWFQDQQHGSGTNYFMNNNRYEGMWFADYQQGEGTYVLLHNGDDYREVTGFPDKRSGKGGYLYLESRAKYEGEWKEDKKNGEGVAVWLRPVKYEGAER